MKIIQYASSPQAPKVYLMSIFNKSAAVKTKIKLLRSGFGDIRLKVCSFPNIASQHNDFLFMDVK